MTTEKNRQALMGMLPKKKEGFAGEFCECSARCDGECGCGADWTDIRYHNFVIDSCADTLCDRVVGVSAIEVYLWGRPDMANITTLATALSEKYIILRRDK